MFERPKANDDNEGLLRVEPIEAQTEVVITLPPEAPKTATQAADESFTSRQIIASYASFIFSSENYPRILAASLLTLLSPALNFVAPYLLGYIVESLNKDETQKMEASSQMTMITLLVLTYSLAQIIPVMRERILVPVEANNRKKLLVKITEHQLEKSLNYHINTPPGDQFYLLQKGYMVTEMGTPLLTKVAPTMVEVTIAVVALSYQYGLTMGAGLSTIFAIYTTYCALTTKPLIQARENMLNTGREAWTTISNTIERYKTIHDFNKLLETLKILESACDKAAKAEIQNNAIPLDISYGQIAIPRLGMLVALLYVGARLQANEFSMTEFIWLFGYLNQLSSTLPAVGDALNKVFASFPDLRYVFGELAKPSEIIDLHPETKLQTNGPAHIRIEDVSFKYPKKDPTFNNISLEILPGQKVALVSKSGGGKSTLYNLLYRYYEPTAGRIFINGQNIAEVSRTSLQESIGLVRQDPDLFNGTVRENIKFGAKNEAEITDEKIFEVATKLNLASFLCGLAKFNEVTFENFVKGLEVGTGEGGKALSGGQQQKVAIIRGFLKDAPIRLLDEISASLDAESAVAINRGIKTLTANTTTLIITHRLAEITNVDMIVVLDEGRIIARGKHQELLQSCELYQTLWRSQHLDSASASVTSFMGTFHHTPAKVIEENIQDLKPPSSPKI